MPNWKHRPAQSAILAADFTRKVYGFWFTSMLPNSPVAAYLRKNGFQGWLVVELAWEASSVITRGLTENLRRSRLWAERVFQIPA